MLNVADSNSTRPYMIRALYEWCVDHHFTPYVAVHVDETVQVPQEYVKNGEIVLNISYDATSGLKLGNDFIEFKARFSGSARGIMVPVNRVLAIYARENGQGMAFPLQLQAPDDGANHEGGGGSSEQANSAPVKAPRNLNLTLPGDTSTPPPPPKTGGKRPELKRVN
jgi:stringent starvation protein B